MHEGDTSRRMLPTVSLLGQFQLRSEPADIKMIGACKYKKFPVSC